jgi:catechol 2,3-dioxygenase-like lactoylglutathione lyase family enzyme
MPEYRIEHAGLTVSDIDRAVDWYVANFGFEVIRRFDKPELEIVGASLKLGGDQLEILQPVGPVAEPDVSGPLTACLRRGGANHIALNVDDVARAYESLRANGVEFITDLLESRFFFCRDPFGTLIEVRQRK